MCWWSQELRVMFWWIASCVVCVLIGLAIGIRHTERSIQRDLEAIKEIVK